MKCAAVTWSSPLHRGVPETSPRPDTPSSVCTLTRRNGDTEWEPPLARMASSRRMGTRTGMQSILVIFMKFSYPFSDAGGPGISAGPDPAVRGEELHTMRSARHLIGYLNPVSGALKGMVDAGREIAGDLQRVAGDGVDPGGCGGTENAGAVIHESLRQR